MRVSRPSRRPLHAILRRAWARSLRSSKNRYGSCQSGRSLATRFARSSRSGAGPSRASSRWARITQIHLEAAGHGHKRAQTSVLDPGRAGAASPPASPAGSPRPSPGPARAAAGPCAPARCSAAGARSGPWTLGSRWSWPAREITQAPLSARGRRVDRHRPLTPRVKPQDLARSGQVGRQPSEMPDRIRRALAQQTHRLVEREIPMHGQDAPCCTDGRVGTRSWMA